MVPHGEMEPVGLQRVLLPPKHDPHISGMLSGGIKIRIISNLGRQVHEHSVHGEEGTGTQGHIFLQEGLGLGEEALNGGAGGGPDGAGLGHEGVKRRLVEAAGVETVVVVEEGEEGEGRGDEGHVRHGRKEGNLPSSLPPSFQPVYLKTSVSSANTDKSRTQSAMATPTRGAVWVVEKTPYGKFW